MKGQIIVACPGAGKSYAATKLPNAIDYDSILIPNKMKNWEEKYAEMINELVKEDKYDYIFVSFNLNLLHLLKEQGLKFKIVVPKDDETTKQMMFGRYLLRDGGFEHISWIKKQLSSYGRYNLCELRKHDIFSDVYLLDTEHPYLLDIEELFKEEEKEMQNEKRIKNIPMEHWDKSRICANCKNKECGTLHWGHSFMEYSESCERYECTERMVEEEQPKNDEIVLYDINNCSFGDVNFQDNVESHNEDEAHSYYDTSIVVGKTSGGKELSVNLQTNVYLNGTINSYIEYRDFRVDGKGIEDNVSEEETKLIDNFYKKLSSMFVKELHNVVCSKLQETKKNVSIGTFSVEVELQPDGKFDVYISHDGSSGEHYKDVTADRIGEFVADEVECVAECYQ